MLLKRDHEGLGLGRSQGLKGSYMTKLGLKGSSNSKRVQAQTQLKVEGVHSRREQEPKLEETSVFNEARSQQEPRFEGSHSRRGPKVKESRGA